jgi:hypothetical protein
MERDKNGCAKLAVTLFVLYVVWQVAALSLRVVGDAFAFAGALAKWVLLGLAGAGGVLALVALAIGGVAGLAGLWNRVTRGRRERQEEYQARYYHYLRAREWERGIDATAQRLRRRKWLSKKDASRYCETADMAVQRLQQLDEDLAMVESLPASQPWAQTIREGADRILHHLERTHNALARLLAQSAVQAIPGMEQDVQEAADELQALLGALEQISRDDVAQARAAIADTSGGVEAATQDVLREADALSRAVRTRRERPTNELRQ